MIVQSKPSRRELRAYWEWFDRRRRDERDRDRQRVELFPPWLSPAQRRYLTGTLTLNVTSGGGGLPVVPGACGYGIGTRAAYGGATNPVVLRVTNLNDSGPGSLRAALTASGPRVVIFEISGTIALSSDINIFENYLTIAGQTAPSPGITIKGGGLQCYAHDVLVQHVRIRPGDGGPVLPQTADHDASSVYDCSSCPTVYTPHDIVWDHCSFSWSGGKLANVDARSPTSNITYWRCIFSEALYRAANVIVSTGQPSSLAMPIVDHTAQVSVLQCLFAHCSDRNPEIHSGTKTHFCNNVIYDWGADMNAYPWATFFYGVEADALFADIIGNVYIAGGSPHPYPLYAIGLWTSPGGSQIYITDNIRDQTLASVTEFFLNTGATDARVGSPAVSLSGISVLAGSATKAIVLANAGARPSNRDAVDARVVASVTGYTGTVISSQNQVGGWPTLAINSRALSTPVSPHAVQASGYTKLEEWMQEYAATVEN